MVKRLSTLRDILRPWYIKAIAAVPVALGAYDACCNQFGWPKIPRLWGMTGSLLPWWGWLLILQAVFVYALFEYVRRMSLPDARLPESLLQSDAEIVSLIEQRIGTLPLGEPTVGEAFNNSDGRASTYTTRLSDRVDKLEGKIDTIAKLATENNTLQQERHDLTEKHIKAAEANAKATHDYATGSVGALQHLIVELGDAQVGVVQEQREFQARIDRYVGSVRDMIERRLSWVDQGMAAIFDRERLLGLAAEIQEIGDELSGPTQGEPLGDSDAWSKKFGGWQKKVEAWARIGGKYRDGVVARVFETPSSEYKGTWKATDNLFPDSDAIHDYKTFRIISRNFHVERGPVENCVQQAAFARPSMKGRVDLGADGLP